MHPHLTARDIERFWSRVEKDGPIPPHRPELGACWLWMPEPARKYGRFHVKKAEFLAHRIAYQIANGPVPDGMLACHHCDTPRCVNPAHLFQGTHEDNNRDMMAKGRYANGMAGNTEAAARGERHVSRTKPERVPRGDRSGPHMHPERMARGERNGQSVFTDDQVREIRARYAAGGISQHALAAAYSVSRGAICHVVMGATWRHLTE